MDCLSQYFIDKPIEECGVIGAISKTNNVFLEIYKGMQAVQHRGELGCGIASSNNNEINYYKNIGLVSDVFQPNILKKFKGKAGIGHTRYATSQNKNVISRDLAINQLHPQIGILNNDLSFAIAFNGNLTNCKELKRNLSNFEFETLTDTEIIKNLIIKNYGQTKSIMKSLAKSYEQMKGAYNIEDFD